MTSSNSLTFCPRCGDIMDNKVPDWWDNKLLNSLCPGTVGPSDLDCIVHNGGIRPQRFFVVEYKGAPIYRDEPGIGLVVDRIPIPYGQRKLFGGLKKINANVKSEFRVSTIHEHMEAKEVFDVYVDGLRWLYPESDWDNRRDVERKIDEHDWNDWGVYPLTP